MEVAAWKWLTAASDNTLYDQDCVEYLSATGIPHKLMPLMLYL
jgi:hypothetical protein